MDENEIREAVERDAAGDHDAREMRVFTGLFWLSALIPMIIEIAHGPSSAPVHLVVIGAVYVWLHRVHRIQDLRAARWTTSRRVALLGGLYVALVALLVLGQSYMLILFGVYSLTFGYSGSFRLGLVFSVIPTLVWGVAWLGYGFPPGALATPFFVWLTANVIAYFTHQVSAQSEERRRLLQEIATARDALAEEERRRGTLEERARVAAEIHDTLAQGFTSIVLLAKGTGARLTNLSESDVAANLGMIERTARDNLAEARRLVEALRPASLDGTSVADAIRRLAERHTTETKVPAAVHVEGEPKLLGGAEDILLLRSVQEGLANVRKHANASSVEVRLAFDDGIASVTVSDDGRGFEPGGGARPVAGGVGGHGLTILRERVAAVGGEVEVRSSPGAGSVLTVRVPVTSTRTVEPA